MAGHFHLLRLVSAVSSGLTTKQRWVYSLQHTTGIDKDVALVDENRIGVISILNMDVPHLLLFDPVRTDHCVVKSDVLVQVVLVCDVFEILQDLRRARVAFCLLSATFSMSMNRL